MDKLSIYTISIFIKSYMTLLELLPYLIAGTLVGEALKYVKLHRLVAKFRSYNTLISTLIAAILGIISPLCTFGTVPVVMRLAGIGIPASVLIVFLISSSMMNPQLFIMTWGGISKEIAIGRILTIIAFSLLMALLLKIIPQKFVLNKNKLEEIIKTSDEYCYAREAFQFKQYAINTLKSLEYVGFYVVIGVVFASSIEVMIPGNLLNKLYGQNKMLQILLMSLLSIPFYSCGGGVIPIVRSMISGGMIYGTALAFLNVGAATRVTVLAALATIVRPIFIFIYVAALIIFSILTGYLFT